MQATSLDNYLIILDNCPMLNIPGFTFPVRQHFLEEIIKILRYWLGQRETVCKPQSWKLIRRLLYIEKFQPPPPSPWLAVQ
jgi:hypothetical protein